MLELPPADEFLRHTQEALELRLVPEGVLQGARIDVSDLPGRSVDGVLDTGELRRSLDGTRYELIED